MEEKFKKFQEMAKELKVHNNTFKKMVKTKIAVIKRKQTIAKNKEEAKENEVNKQIQLKKDRKILFAHLRESDKYVRPNVEVNNKNKYCMNIEYGVKLIFNYYRYQDGHIGGKEITEIGYTKLSWPLKPTEQQVNDRVFPLCTELYKTIAALTTESNGDYGVKCKLLSRFYKGYDNKRIFNAYRIPKEILMKLALPTLYKRYDGLNLNVPNEENCCVDEYIIKKYSDPKNRIPIDKKRLQTYFTELKKKHNVTGLSINHIQEFCDTFKISHYASDWRKFVIHKSIKKSSHYQPLMYFMISEHMYPIEDPVIKQRIQKQCAAKEAGNDYFVSSDKGDEHDKKDQVKIDRFKLPMVEIMDDIKDEDLYKQIKELKDCNVFVNRKNLMSLQLYLFKTLNTEYVYESLNGSIISKIDMDNNVIVYNNVNYNTTDPESKCKLTWRDSIAVCKIAGIEWKNDNIQSISNTLYSTFNDKGNGQKYIRKGISQTERISIMQGQSGKCKNCKKEVDTYEIDHIKPLWGGGSNDINNLQALCGECHLYKSNLEHCNRVFNVNNTQSNLNKTTQQIFNKTKNGFRHCKFDSDEEVDHLIEKIKLGQLHALGLDIKKCRKNILRHGTGEFSVYSVLDDVKAFAGDIKTGFYYVVTDNLLPMKGNGWYDYQLVQYCMDRNIITSTNIKYELIPSLKLKPTHFNDFIDHVFEKFGKYSKFMVNAGLIGLMGVKSKMYVKLFLTRSLQQASMMKFLDNDVVDDDVCIYDEDDFYVVKTFKETHFTDSFCPIYNAVLDREAIELHKISEQLTQGGGEIVYLNTDNAVAVFKNKKQADKVAQQSKNYFFDEETNKEPKYKIESELFGKHICKEFAQTDVETYNVKPEYKIIKDPMNAYPEDVENKNFDKFAKKLLSFNTSFQIDALAGCGKTTLIRSIITQLKDKQIPYICLAPTHKAAGLMKLEDDEQHGKTINSFMIKFAVGKKLSQPKEKYIIIDEKSMVSEFFFKQLYNIKRAYPDIKFIISGDHGQLPAVCERAHFDVENSDALHFLSDGVMVKLSKCRRADKELFNKYTKIMKVKKDEFTHEECPKSLCFHNSLRKKINDRWMLRKRGKDFITIPKFEANDKSQDMHIFKGLPVIACRTMKKYKFVNSDEGTIETFDKENVTINIEKMFKVTLTHDEFQKAFQPAYSITIHRSQGMTFNFPYTIYEWEKLSKALKYVALSRSTSMKYVNVV